MIFWNPVTGGIGTDTGRAFALGEDLIDHPATTAFSRWLNIYPDPLEWLRNNRRGIVVIRCELAFDKLCYVPRIAVAEALLPTYRKMVKPRHMPRLAMLPGTERTVA